MIDGRRSRRRAPQGQHPTDNEAEAEAEAPATPGSQAPLAPEPPSGTRRISLGPEDVPPAGLAEVADPLGEHRSQQSPDRPTAAPGPKPPGFRLNLAARLVAHGVRADHITLLGVVAAALTGYLLAIGWFYLAVVVGTAGCLMDTLDGAVAKAAGSSSKRGAFFDSVMDRVADGFIFGGLAWYFAAGPGHDPKLALLPFAILAVGNVISYERAKAESLGYEAKGGLMERAERLIYLGVASLLHVILVPLLWIMLALCTYTAVQRFAKVWRQATARPDAPAHARSWRPARVESRWRAWRQASSAARRPRVATPSRVRTRRRGEPLTTRVRRMLATDGVAAAGRPSAASGTSGAAGERPRRARNRSGAASSLRRRLSAGR